MQLPKSRFGYESDERGLIIYSREDVAWSNFDRVRPRKPEFFHPCCLTDDYRPMIGACSAVGKVPSPDADNLITHAKLQSTVYLTDLTFH